MEILLFLIIKIIALTVLGAFNGLLGYFLDYCFWENSVFSGYLPWLAKNLVKKQLPADYTEVLLLPKEAQGEEFIRRGQKIFHYKMFGGCAICFNVWVSMVIYIPLNLYLDFGWWFYPIFSLTSHLILRKLLRV